MERLKSLDPPHKGLRNALGKAAYTAVLNTIKQESESEMNEILSLVK